MSLGSITDQAFYRVLAAGLFFSVFACLEAWFPRRMRNFSRKQRWPSNIGIAVLNVFFMSALIRFVLPASAIEFAEIVQVHGWGALYLIEMPQFTKLIVSVIFLDLVIYFQHVLFHHVPQLWSIHRMHHTDLDLDVTSGSRFHPIEIFLSFVIKLMAIALIGAPPQAVFIFELLLNATALFNHSNLNLTLGFDRVLRYFLVTPDMHRVHHSMEVVETNSNYGFNLPWWDRVFGTYRDQPRAGHVNMKIGIKDLASPQELSLWTMLKRGVGSESVSIPISNRNLNL